MGHKSLSVSDRLYHGLLLAYPAPFRKRYGAEMAQVFRTSCQATWDTCGTRGLLRLWFPTLWDWALSAAREQLAALLHWRGDRMDTTALDRQMGDMVWMVACALRSAYNVRQAFEALAGVEPEPTASMCKRLVADLQEGLTLEAALAHLQETYPSSYLARLAQAIGLHGEAGGKLARSLVAIADQALADVGSDRALFPRLRETAMTLGAPIPERARVEADPDRLPPLPDAAGMQVLSDEGNPLLTADYGYERARVLVFVAGSPNYRAFNDKAGEGLHQRVHELGYRDVVVRQDIAEAGVDAVAAWVQAIHPDT